jgi:hypothetical protein
MDKNPLLQPEDYFSGYKEKIEALKHNPEVVELDKLCYELFERNEVGKRFLELVRQRYLIPALAKPGTPTYQLDIMWAEGFKDFGRMLISSVISHQQRIIKGEIDGRAK